MQSSGCKLIGGGTASKPRSVTVGSRNSSIIELTSFNSVPRCDLKKTGPVRRRDAAVFSKIRAESAHACFVVLLTFFTDVVDLFRRCLGTESGGCGWGMREGASPPKLARCIHWGRKKSAACRSRGSLAKNDTASGHHPTMFKRVDRRRKRKENEERLGLDEDQWGVFGLHHTDSSESESDSSDSASTSSSDGHSTKKRKRGASPQSYDESSEEEDGESEPASDDEEDEEGSNDHGTHRSLTIASALKEPIRPIDPHSEAWMCVLCPGKTLKHATMVKVHETSRVRRPQSWRSHCANFHHRSTSGVSSACKSSQWISVRKKTSKTCLQNRRQKHSLKQAKPFCRSGRERGCVETPYAFSDERLCGTIRKPNRKN